MDKLKKQLEELEKRKFYLSMKDHWSSEDYDIDRDLNRQIETVKTEIEVYKLVRVAVLDEVIGACSKGMIDVITLEQMKAQV